VQQKRGRPASCIYWLATLPPWLADDLKRERPRGLGILDAFIVAADRSNPSEAVLRRLHPKALKAIRIANLDPETEAELIARLERIRSLCQDVRWYAPPYSVLEQRRQGRPDFLQVRSALRRELEALKPFAALPTDARRHPDGFTASELRREADIGLDFWRRLLAASGLEPTPRGGQHRRFSNREIRSLADAAGRLGTPKARHAAAQ
jgi:hypothetical protein